MAKASAKARTNEGKSVGKLGKMRWRERVQNRGLARSNMRPIAMAKTLSSECNDKKNSNGKNERKMQNKSEGKRCQNRG